MFFSWMSYSLDAAMLGWDSQRVIGMRLARIGAGGPRATSEAFLMINEKIAAAMEAGAVLATGGSGHKVVRGYRRHVRANIRRLGRRTKG